MGAADADRKSGGTWCILLCPTHEPATQMHSFADRLCQSLFPRIVPRCLSGGEKRKSEKARLRRGITLLVTMPGHLLNHLMKMESLLLSLRQTAASSGLSSTRLIASWTGAALWGRWSRLSSGFAGDAAARRVGSGPPGRSRACWCRQSATVTSKLEGRRGGCPAWTATVGGWREREYRFYICRSKMRTVFPNKITSSYYGVGDINS